MTLELLVLVKRGVEYQLALREKVGTDHHETVLLPREDLLGRRLHNGRRHERAGDLLGQDGVGVRFRGESELLRRAIMPCKQLREYTFLACPDQRARIHPLCHNSPKRVYIMRWHDTTFLKWAPRQRQ